MRVVFIFVSTGGAPEGQVPAWNPKSRAKNKYLEEGGLESEGLFWMFQKMKSAGIISDFITIIESTRGTGRFNLKGNLGFVVPHVSCIDELLRPGDVLFVRGGWRGWCSWLESRKRKNWLLLYGANTGRERWTFWDVILNDLNIEAKKDRVGRYWFPFRKPIHADIFHPLDLPIKYDFCIGASYIHDKKGQWRFVEVLKRWKGRKPRCIMPGAPRRGAKTNPALEEAKSLGVEVPGMLPRPELNKVLNSSKFFVHLGTSGQNDRGPLEALRCGCRIVLASPQYHSPHVVRVSTTPDDKDDYDDLAHGFKIMLSNYNNKDRELLQLQYESSLGENVVLEDMNFLFNNLSMLSPAGGFE